MVLPFHSFLSEQEHREILVHAGGASSVQRPTSLAGGLREEDFTARLIRVLKIIGPDVLFSLRKRCILVAFIIS